MRITFVLPGADLSGGNRVIAIYAERLSRRGHEVLVIFPPPRVPSVARRVRSFLRNPLRTRRVSQGPSHLDETTVTTKVLDSWRPITAADVPDADVVVATWWETAEWVWSLPFSKGAKVHFMQDYEVWGGNVPRVDAVCRLPIPKIVIAKWVSELLERRFGQTPPSFIPNSVDISMFCAEARGKQPIPTVGFLYTTFRNKGVDVSIEAVRRARAIIPHLRVVSFGSEPTLRELPLPADTTYSLRLPNDQLRVVYAQCDAWLFGTRNEGFGLPILEAMACRTPVIATPAGAAPELLSGGGGVLVKPEDPQSMAEAIVEVARMPEREWQAISDAAYATATRYSWDDATALFEKTLEHAKEQTDRGGVAATAGR